MRPSAHPGRRAHTHTCHAVSTVPLELEQGDKSGTPATAFKPRQTWLWEIYKLTSILAVSRVKFKNNNKFQSPVHTQLFTPIHGTTRFSAVCRPTYPAQNTHSASSTPGVPNAPKSTLGADRGLWSSLQWRVAVQLLGASVRGIFVDTQVHLSGKSNFNQVWVSPAVKFANPSRQTMGHGGEKKAQFIFNRGG